MRSLCRYFNMSQSYIQPKPKKGEYKFCDSSPIVLYDFCSNIGNRQVLFATISTVFVKCIGKSLFYFY